MMCLLERVQSREVGKKQYVRFMATRSQNSLSTDVFRLAKPRDVG